MVRVSKFRRPNGYWYVRYWIGSDPVDEPQGQRARPRPSDTGSGGMLKSTPASNRSSILTLTRSSFGTSKRSHPGPPPAIATRAGGFWGATWKSAAESREMAPTGYVPSTCRPS